ncbi:MAG: universal stress protein [Lautropia sp.]
MYQHILIATDGSALAEKAVETGTRLAASLNARLTVAHVGAPYAPPLYAGDFVPSSYLSAEEHEARVRAAAEEILARAAAQAEKVKVPCRTDFAVADHPYAGVLEIANRNQCDLIVMASHGRSGWSAVLLGSETQRMLSHSRIDVLVVRHPDSRADAAEATGAAAEAGGAKAAAGSAKAADPAEPVVPPQPPFS